MSESFYFLISCIAILLFFLQVMKGHDGYLHVIFLDVGQGDACLIITPLGKQILIDAGKDADLGASLSQYMPSYDRSLDLLVMTHPDLDHIGGMFSLVREYDVSYIIHSAAPVEKKEHKELLGFIEEKHLPHREGVVGDRIYFDSGIFLEILSAPHTRYTDTNEYSLVMKLVYGRSSVILTGDASVLNEYDMLQVYADYLATDILKAGHHGSKTSSSIPWLEQLDPHHTILSFGCENRYGHPHPEVVARLSGQIFDTCSHGDSGFISDGRMWYVE